MAFSIGFPRCFGFTRTQLVLLAFVVLNGAVAVDGFSGPALCDGADATSGAKIRCGSDTPGNVRFAKMLSEMWPSADRELLEIFGFFEPLGTAADAVWTALTSKSAKISSNESSSKLLLIFYKFYGSLLLIFCRTLWKNATIAACLSFFCAESPQMSEWYGGENTLLKFTTLVTFIIARYWRFLSTMFTFREILSAAFFGPLMFIIYLFFGNESISQMIFQRKHYV